MARKSRNRRRRQERIIDAYLHHASEVFAAVFTPNCCLNASRVTLDVLRHFGITAHPESVLVSLYNPTWVLLVEAHGRRPVTEAEAQQWVAMGGWCLGCGGLKEPSEAHGGWDGHLVVRVGSMIIDPSAGQFDRPEKGIMVPQIVTIEVTTAFRRGERLGLGHNFANTYIQPHLLTHS